MHVLQVHGQALQAVGDFTRGRRAIQAADLLEVGELRDFHAVQPDFPAQAPGAQRGVFPVVLDKADVVLGGVYAQRLQRTDVQVQDVGRRGLEHHLELVIVLQAVRVFAVAAILGATRRLHVGGAPRLRADRAQERGRVRGTGADFHVVGLQQGATLLVPVFLERKDDLLKGEHRILGIRLARQACRGRGKPGILTGPGPSRLAGAAGRLHLCPGGIPRGAECAPGGRSGSTRLRLETNGRMIPGYVPSLI
ncbi:hypothetical protein D3C73_868820 [compost metagenome]